jgi:hypothetical protein
VSKVRVRLSGEAKRAPPGKTREGLVRDLVTWCGAAPDVVTLQRASAHPSPNLEIAWISVAPRLHRH